MPSKRSSPSDSHHPDVPDQSGRSPLRELLGRGEEVVNVFLDELTGGANLRGELESAVHRATRARATVDKNMEAVLSALNLPTRRDYKRVVEEIHALQGAIVNLNMKMDRLIAQGAAPSASPGTSVASGGIGTVAAAVRTKARAKPRATASPVGSRRKAPSKTARAKAAAAKARSRPSATTSARARKRA